MTMRALLTIPSRSGFWTAIVAGLLLGACDDGASKGYTEIEWDDLIPGESRGMDALAALAGNDDPLDPARSTSPEMAILDQVVMEYDAQDVRLPGYLLPLDMGAEGAREFLLVPYTGACIHVPPPPPNQIVFVKTEDPYEPRELFEAVFVSGRMSVVAMTTDIADVGYTMDANHIEAYEEEQRKTRSVH